MATTAELQAELTSLKKAQADYIAGKQAVSVSYDGHTVTLNKTSLGLIKRRIRELQRCLGQRPAPRSFRPVF